MTVELKTCIFAREVAAKAHLWQMYGSRPYIEHVDEVADVVCEFFGEDHLTLTCALLHDVVKDSDVTIEYIYEIFGKDVGDAVRFVTDEPGRNRRERKSATEAKWSRMLLDRSASVSYDALVAGVVTKLADRIANLRECRRRGNVNLLEMYRKEQPVFAASLRQLCDARTAYMWAEIATLLEPED